MQNLSYETSIYLARDAVNKTKNENNCLQKLSDRERSNRERIILSYSLSRFEDLKILKILQNEHEIKINEGTKLKKSVLCKYLIQKGLEELDQKYGQIKEILKKEKMITE